MVVVVVIVVVDGGGRYAIIIINTWSWIDSSLAGQQDLIRGWDFVVSIKTHLYIDPLYLDIDPLHLVIGYHTRDTWILTHYTWI